MAPPTISVRRKPLVPSNGPQSPDPKRFPIRKSLHLTRRNIKVEAASLGKRNGIKKIKCSQSNDWVSVLRF
jgi:hypothetical protein